MVYEGPKEEVKNQWADRPMTTTRREKETSGPKEIRKKNKSPTNWFGKNLCKANMQAYEGMRRNKANPEVHAPFRGR